MLLHILTGVFSFSCLLWCRKRQHSWMFFSVHGYCYKSNWLRGYFHPPTWPDPHKINNCYFIYLKWHFASDIWIFLTLTATLSFKNWNLTSSQQNTLLKSLQYRYYKLTRSRDEYPCGNGLSVLFGDSPVRFGFPSLRESACLQEQVAGSYLMW